MNPDSGKDFKFITLKVSHEDETWSYDTLDEFLADYRASKLKASLSLMCGKYLLAAETYAGM